MWLRILGLPEADRQWWTIDHLEENPGGQWDDVLHGLLQDQFPGYQFSWTRRPTSGPDLTVIARPGSRAGPGSRGPGPEVLAVTEDGPDAGRLAPLPRHGFTVGRNRADWRLADPFLSAPHFRATVEPEGIRISVSDSAASTEDIPQGPWCGDRPFRAGSTTFRLFRGRPDPLPRPEGLPEPVVDPGPEPARPNPLLQAIMAAGPLVIGIVMAVITGSWYFLLFSLVSVGVAGVMWGQHRTAARRYGHTIRDQAERFRDRLDALSPTPGRLALAARSDVLDRFGIATTGTDEAGAGPAVRWGTGTTRLRLPSGRDREKWERWTTVDLPAVSALLPDRTTVVTGQRSTLDAITHWLLVQLCRDALSSGRGVLVRTLQGDSWWGGGRNATAGTALCGPGTTTGGLPASWHRVVLTETGSPEAHRVRSNTGDRVDPDQGTATLSGLALARFHWHGMAMQSAGWLLDELGASARPPLDARGTPLALPRTLMSCSAIDGLRTELAAGDEPVSVDLVAQGPHLLVAGTTGSGKSELLLTLLTSVAAEYPAVEVSFVLMDFKGGSSFAPLADLPHTMSVETNLSEAESLRTLDALAAELRRREELFLAAGTPDFRTYRSTHPDRELPRLVVAIDELRVLVDDHPFAATLLARLAATGRSLGFHLVLATQRAQGAVGPDIRSNLGTVVCLRTATEQESWDLLGSPSAFAIGVESPGRAFVKHGGQPARPFQAGQYSMPTGPPVLRPWTGNTPPETGTVPWPDLVHHLRDEAGRRGLAVPDPVVTPGLPEAWTPTSAEQSAVPGAVVVGLADDPGRRVQEPVRWVPGLDAPAAWIGTSAGGLDEVARTVIAQLADHEAGPFTVLLDGSHLAPSPEPPENWSVLVSERCSPDALVDVFARIREELADRRPVRLVVTAWGRWATERVGTGYEAVEEHIATLVRDHGPAALAVALFGGRELAGGRVIGQVPLRFYLPAGSTPEHRMVWPALQRVREIPGRAVMVCPDHPAPGLAVQLARQRVAQPAEQRVAQPANGSATGDRDE